MSSSNKVFYPNSGNDNCFLIEDRSFWFRCRNRVISYFVSKNSISKNRVFLDVGGGNGFVTYMLQEMGLDSWLIEPGKGGCENAKKRNIKNIFQGTFEQFISQKNLPAFDAGLFDVLEHIENHQEFLNIISSAQKSGDKIYITVPAYQLLWSHEDVYAGHFRRYSKLQIKMALENAGYEEIDFSGFFITLLPLIFILRKMRDFFGGSNRKAQESDHRESLVSKLLTLALQLEIFLISKGIRYTLGSSFMIVGTKK